MIHNLVGADGQIFLNLLEETIDLLLIHVVQAVGEVALHQQYTLSDVGDVLLRNVRIALLVIAFFKSLLFAIIVVF